MYAIINIIFLHVLGTIQKIQKNVTQVKNIVADETNVTVQEINHNVKEAKQYVDKDHGK